MNLRDEIIGKLCLLCGGTGDLVDGKCPLFLCDAVRDTAGQTLAIIRKAVEGLENCHWGQYSSYESGWHGFESCRQSVLALLERV